MSGSGENSSPPASQPHTKIAWAGHTGVPGSRYCCVCSYTVREKPSVSCSQADCPNVACKGCCAENTFCCTNTSQLRTARGITRQVIYEPQDSPSLPLTPPQDQESTPTQQLSPDNEDTAIKEELLANPPEELVDIILRQRSEIYSLKSTLDAYKHHSSRVLQHRAALVEALNTLDGLAQVQQVAPSPAAATHACSALPSKIDSDWQEVCASHQGWADWWNSGKPKPLRKVTSDTSPPRNAPDSSPPPRPSTTTATTAATETAGRSNPPPRRPAATNATNASTITHPAANRESTRRSPQNQHHYNSRRQDNRYQGSQPFCGRCRQRGHTSGRCSVVVCDYCGRRGHHIDQCRTRQSEESRWLECSYCLRRGHDESRCYTRVSEARQERLLRAILAEHHQPAPHPQPAPTQPAPYRADLAGATHPAWSQPPHLIPPLLR